MNESNQPIETSLEALRDVPPPMQQAHHRAAFLEQARTLRVSSAPLVRLERVNGHSPKEERRMTAQSLRRTVLLIALFTALLVAGGVLAQEIIEFFTQGEDDTTTIEVYFEPITDSEIMTPFPHYLQELTYQAGFDVYIPTYLPGGYSFAGSTGSRSNHSAAIIYECQGWQIGIGQLHVPLAEAPRNEVGASAIIETIPLGENTGQYIRGTWLDHPVLWNSSEAPVTVNAEWTNDTDFQSLVWYQDDTFISIHTLGFSDSRELFAADGCTLDKDDYVAIAYSLQSASLLQPTTATPVILTSVDEVIAQADFDVEVPTYIPDGYTFDSGQYYDDRSLLSYQCGDGEVWISVSQRRTSLEDTELARSEIGASATIEPVQIGDAAGQYIRGQWLVRVSSDAAESVDAGTSVPSTAQWTNNSEHQRLVWYQDEYLFTIMTDKGPWSRTAAPPCNLDKDDYVAIANSLQPFSSLDDGE